MMRERSGSIKAFSFFGVGFGDGGGGVITATRAFAQGAVDVGPGLPYSFFKVGTIKEDREEKRR